MTRRPPRLDPRLAWRCIAAIGVAVVLTATSPVLRGARAVVVLSQLMGAEQLDWLSQLVAAPVREEDAVLRFEGSAVRARRYLPEGLHDAPGLVLLHGVHPRGIDETRLRAFARSLAGAGVRVLTPELSEFLSYRIEASTVRKIRALAAEHARYTDRVSSAVMGISFAGGLALLAAAQQHGVAPIGMVVSVGGHHDLMRLCRYYAGEPVRGPHGEPSDVAPHPYGARVMIREHLDRLFSPADVPIARRALDSYLRDRPRQAQREATALPPAAQATMRVLLSDARSPELSQLLMTSAELVRKDLELASPRGKLGALNVPVFLVHGTGDPIIPSIETRWLASEVPQAMLRRVVITPLLRHAEFPHPPSLGETWALVDLMTQILGTLRTPGQPHI